MSILIKGMEMPTSCRACMFSRTDSRNVDWCVLTEKDLPCDCPLVPVPPHGDLIDKSGVEVLSWYEKDEGDFTDGVLFVLDKLDELPVIIPAEEGE